MEMDMIMSIITMSTKRHAAAAMSIITKTMKKAAAAVMSITTKTMTMKRHAAAAMSIITMNTMNTTIMKSMCRVCMWGMRPSGTHSS